MNRGVLVINNLERGTECNCCDYDENKENHWYDLYEIKFNHGNITTTIRLCKTHLKELNEGINASL